MPVSTASAPGTTSNSRGKALPDTHSTANGAHPLQLLPLPLAATQEQPPPTSVPPAPASGGASEAASSNSPPHCKHCEEFGVKGGGGGVYWRLHLDRDLLETIISIYPEWFKDCNVSPGAMAEGGPSGLGATPPSSPGNPSSGGLRRKSVSSAASVSSSSPPHSPPKAQVDDSPLQKCMDRNKESLKVKLMLRRPINQLVAQGIMPPLKTPPAFHEQRQKLERAKTGDLLKAKIQQRPNRTELVRQHILEADMGHVDPSLAERQRMLKKARLQDTLNDQLSHRPGPLELIQKNILHTEEIIERAVKEGQISFKATCEGHLSRPQHPSQYVTFEEDSGGSSEGAAASPPSSSQLPVVSAVPPDTPSIPHSPGLASTTSSLSPLSSVSSPQSVAPLPPPPPPPPPPLPTSTSLPPPPPAVPSTTRPAAPVAQVTIGTVSSQMPVPSPLSSVSTTPSTTLSQVSQLSAVLSAHREQVSSSSSKNRKKSKTKSQPKTRTIKFHEYKGPPNAQRNSSSLVSPPPVETSYELLLQQQQLFLQWQLEWQHKYPQIILPAAQKPSDVGLITVAAPTSTATSSNAVQGSASVPPPTPPPQPPPPTTPIFLQAQSPGFSSSQGSASGSTPLPTTSITTTTVSNPILSPVSAVSVSLSSPVSSLKDVAALRCLPPKMEDMKVNDLKSELKKRNLPVSGSKPQLIERLRMYAEAAPSAGGSTCLQMGSPPPPPPLPRTSLSSNPSPSQQTVFGMDAGLEDSLPPLGIDSPVLSPSGTSMDALSSPSPPPPSPLHLQSKSNQPPASAVTLQVFSPASEMEVDPEAAVVVILAPPASSSPAQGPSSSPPPPTPIQASPLSPPASSSSPPLRPPPPPPPLPPPPQLTGSCVVSSSTQSVPDDNTIIGNDIIAQQQKKIKELQRELLRSQFQLQCERQKEQLLLQQQKQLASQQQIATQTQQRTSGGTAAPANDLKPTHRLVLQQHIQNKIQQQNLQEQLQHLQKMQLQQKQQQLQLQQKQKQAMPAKQQEMQQQLQVAANARANLAAFLQSQNSSASSADNNNSPQATNINSNNNNNNNNLKKGTNDQEQKVLLSQRNELNKSCVKPTLSGNKVTPGTTPNGIVGHQRAASVSSFFGNTFAPSKVTQQQPPMSPAQQMQKSQVVLVPEEMLRKTDELGNGSEGSLSCLKPSLSPPLSPAPSPATPPTTQQFLITYSPPHYEEATKPLKIKLEPGSSYANTGGGGGNLESSSVRGTSNKSVKSQIVDDVLEILIKNGELPPSAANDPSTPTTPGRSQGLIFSSNLPGQQTAPINSMVNHQIGQPLFADIHKVKTEEIPNESKHIPSHHSNSQHVFHPFDFVLGADTSPTPLHRVASHESAKHCEENPSHELMPLQQTEDLGLDLDVLDAMEFDLLGAPSHHPPPSHVDMGPGSPVTPDGRGMDHISDIHIHSSMPRDEDVDMEAVVGPGASGELSEMPMDLDVSDWLDSLIAPASGVAQSGNSSPFHQQQSAPQHNQYDPLLSHTHDPFDLFDDTELRMAAWDRVDFAA